MQDKNRDTDPESRLVDAGRKRVVGQAERGVLTYTHGLCGAGRGRRPPSSAGGSALSCDQRGEAQAWREAQEEGFVCIQLIMKQLSSKLKK